MAMTTQEIKDAVEQVCFNANIPITHDIGNPQTTSEDLVASKKRRKELLRRLEDKAIEEGDYQIKGLNFSPATNPQNGGRKNSNFNQAWQPEK